MKVLIAGYGNMGKTYANSFISSRFIKPNDIYVLVKTLPTNVTATIPNHNFITSLAESSIAFDIVIIAVKPQDFKELASSLKPYISNEQVVLSVMAGVKIQTIQNLLNCTKIIRSMPNIPSQIGLGMTVFTASPQIDRKEFFIIQNLINTTGKSIYVENEQLINVATAISGSGPAYVFYFMNAIIKAAVELGFNESEAELLVNQTFMGSVAIQNSNSLSNEEWIKKVASKGGTTESALKIFQKNEVENNIIQAVKAANDRAFELGN